MINNPEVKNFLEKLNYRIESSHKASSKETSAKVLKMKKDQFDNYGANEWDRNPFPPIKESTIKRKHGEDRPLLRSGKLKNSLSMEEGDDFLGIKSPEVFDEYGRSYTERAEKFITKNGGKHYFNAISEEEAQKAVNFYVETFVRKMKESGI